MRRFRAIRAMALFGGAFGLLGGSACDVFPLAGSGAPTSQPTGTDAGVIKLRIHNISGLPINVEAIFTAADEQVRLTQRYLPASGPASTVEGVWTLAKTVTVRAKLASDAPISANSLVQVGDLLFARVFRFGQDFTGGEVIDFDVPVPERPAGDILDCNHNGINDALDLTSGVSDDCDGNTIPDECQNDTDSDSFIDPCDECPNDSQKHVPGVCGCGHAETDDDDGDGTTDCLDTCTDTDSDGFGDPGYPANTCPEDGCPNDPLKSDPGICGCGNVDDPTDSDSDGVPDCVDLCPGSDDHADCNSNGIPDGCDVEPIGSASDCDDNGVPDECDDDSDSDGIIDPCDLCPKDPLNDEDDDGVCGDVDFCPDTPVEEPVNEDGCSCSQIDCEVTSSNNPPDHTPPFFLDCPNEAFVLNSDPGACTANFELPALQANDDRGPLTLCGAGGNPPTNGCIECDHGGGAFPVGTTHVTCTARDASGNTSICGFDVVVNAVNEIRATVRLIGVNAGAGKSRCIKFTPLCNETSGDPVYQQVEFTGNPATGTAFFSLPCGEGCYTCLCAKDEQHTFPDTQPLQIVGGRFETSMPLDLYGGDDDNDGGLDSNDVTLLVAQIGRGAIDAGCPATNVGPQGVHRDADFDLSGEISISEDYAFFTQALSHFNNGFFPIQPISCGCTPAQGLTMDRSATPGGRLVIPVGELDPAIAAGADLNADGFFDYQDVEIYESRNGLPADLSSAMKFATLNAGS